MKIPLHPDAPKTINCKIYPLNKEEENYVREFLIEEEEKGYIYPGASPLPLPPLSEKRKKMERNGSSWTTEKSTSTVCETTM